MNRAIVRAVAAALAVAWAGACAGQGDEEEDLALAYGDKSFVTIASGVRQPVARAPSVATVITAEDIEAIGAADQDEVLETVPGLHVARSGVGYNPIYTIRGIHTQYNPQVLMLVNGIPVTSAFTGARSQVWGGVPVENIARIEVIRGPGSALYGADAFSGVINIITKTAADINGTQIGVRAGSFKSRDAWVQHGGTWGGFDVAAYLRVGATDGQRQIIAADALSGTPFPSLAPGPVNLGRDAIDARLDLAHDKWRLRAGYQQRDNGGTGAGVASALDPKGHGYGEHISTDLTWQDANFVRDLDVTAQASYLHITEQSDLTLYPPGFPGFPDGVIGNPYKWERHLRFNLSAAYSGLQSHKLRFGAGTQNDDLYRTKETKNYALVPIPGGFFPAPLGAVVDVSDSAPFLRPHSRTVSHAYVQDEWAFAQDWYLTAGVRRDQYSDFGGTTNPRLALVWETAYNLTSKLLYGRAFRPPSFAELYNINNPVALGNPNLKPETNESVELAFAWQAASTLQANLNLFRYRMKDILRFVQNPDASFTAQNAGRQNGQGLEVELVWEASRSLRLSGNYAQQRSIDEATGLDSSNAPRHHVYARADWRFMPGWTLNTQVNHVADRRREPSDTRPAIPDYHTVDLTLRKQKWKDDWDFAFTVRNLFDADAREPSPAPGLIPGDLPLAPREWRFELRHQL
ncbi:ligand-gated channel [Sulfuricella sp. T08]|uniref:TonB-dependent receptor plug domain-containing protein n=1 Tax=Sulfuricella sp. T08 TaxID=1632857 RepID=UPI00061797C5|nr:TonB-dependent receptor [Sulfuricella sp. T08]GAO35942.1 ligand-gated channel [Sulfuricella sp. T08]